MFLKHFQLQPQILFCTLPIFLLSFDARSIKVQMQSVVHSVLGFEGDFSAAINNGSAYPTAFCTALCPCSVSGIFPHTAHLLTSSYSPTQKPQSSRLQVWSALYCFISHFTIYAHLLPDSFPCDFFLPFAPKSVHYSFITFSYHIYLLILHARQLPTADVGNEDRVFSALFLPSLDVNMLEEESEGKGRNKKAQKYHASLVQSYQHLQNYIFL